MTWVPLRVSSHPTTSSLLAEAMPGGALTSKPFPQIPMRRSTIWSVRRRIETDRASTTTGEPEQATSCRVVGGSSRMGKLIGVLRGSE